MHRKLFKILKYMIFSSLFPVTPGLKEKIPSKKVVFFLLEGRVLECCLLSNIFKKKLYFINRADRSDPTRPWYELSWFPMIRRKFKLKISKIMYSGQTRGKNLSILIWSIFLQVFLEKSWLITGLSDTSYLKSFQEVLLNITEFYSEWINERIFANYLLSIIS